MGIAFVVGQAGDITASPPDNPDTDLHCRTLTAYDYIQAVNDVHSYNVCTQYATKTVSFLQTTFIQWVVYTAVQHYTI